MLLEVVAPAVGGAGVPAVSKPWEPENAVGFVGDICVMPCIGI